MGCTQSSAALPESNIPKETAVQSSNKATADVNVLKKEAEVSVQETNISASLAASNSASRDDSDNKEREEFSKEPREDSSLAGNESQLPVEEEKIVVKEDKESGLTEVAVDRGQSSQNPDESPASQEDDKNGGLTVDQSENVVESQPEQDNTADGSTLEISTMDDGTQRSSVEHDIAEGIEGTQAGLSESQSNETRTSSILEPLKETDTDDNILSNSLSPTQEPSLDDDKAEEDEKQIDQASSEDGVGEKVKPAQSQPVEANFDRPSETEKLIPDLRTVEENSSSDGSQQSPVTTDQPDVVEKALNVDGPVEAAVDVGVQLSSVDDQKVEVREPAKESSASGDQTAGVDQKSEEVLNTDEPVEGATDAGVQLSPVNDQKVELDEVASEPSVSGEEPYEANQNADQSDKVSSASKADTSQEVIKTRSHSDVGNFSGIDQTTKRKQEVPDYVAGTGGDSTTQSVDQDGLMKKEEVTAAVVETQKALSLLRNIGSRTSAENTPGKGIKKKTKKKNDEKPIQDKKGHVKRAPKESKANGTARFQDQISQQPDLEDESETENADNMKADILNDILYDATAPEDDNPDTTGSSPGREPNASLKEEQSSIRENGRQQVSSGLAKSTTNEPLAAQSSPKRKAPTVSLKPDKKFEGKATTQSTQKNDKKSSLSKSKGTTESKPTSETPAKLSDIEKARMFAANILLEAEESAESPKNDQGRNGLGGWFAKQKEKLQQIADEESQAQS